MKPDKSTPAYQKPSTPAADPLKPRPRMLVVLAIVFALWLAFLLTMYFTTVYPHRHIEARPTATTLTTSQAMSLMPS